jgi:ribosomal-protein-alanine N-acetyltransferase
MISDLEVRLATLNDCSEIAGLSRADIEFGLPWGWTPPRVARAIKDSATNVAVIRDRNRLLGFGIMKYGDDSAHLLLLGVRTSYRRLGIGGSLLAWLEKVARVAGIRTVQVQARDDNLAARAFYRKHGYRETAHVAGMYHKIADGVRLEKRLGRRQVSG